MGSIAVVYPACLSEHRVPLAFMESVHGGPIAASEIVISDLLSAFDRAGFDRVAMMSNVSVQSVVR